MKNLTKSVGICVSLAVACLLAHPAEAQRLGGEELIEAIRDGGYYLVMRHASAAVPTGGGGGRGGFGGFGGGGGRGGFGGGRGGAEAPVDVEREPELTEESVGLLTGARHAFIAFKIPVEAIYTSPTRRAAQHAEELPFTEITEVEALGSGMSPDWLAARVREAPAGGGNTIIVTHAPIITGALDIATVDEGETLVVEPGGAVVGRLDLREWSVLAVELTEF